MRKAVDDKRKEVKEQCLEPYQRFEEQAKELMGLIDEPIQLIDSQIKEMEKRRRAERRQKIEELYEKIIGDVEEYLPLEKIYNSKWENASTTMKSVEEELTEVVASVRSAVGTLQAMTSDAVPEALRRFKETLDLASSIAYINHYEAQRAEILRKEEQRRQEEEERKRLQEEERIRRQERERIAREEAIRREEREKAQKEIDKEAAQEAAEGFFSENEEDELPFEQASTVTAFYKVVATQEELEQVEMAFNSIGIYFERRDLK